MDKVTNYKKIVGDIAQEIADMTPTDDISETQLIMDSERKYCVIFFGLAQQHTGISVFCTHRCQT